MQTLTMIGQLLLGLSILVAIHEFGHFLAARAFGMRVDKFFIFFDFGKKKLFSFKKGHTEYGIGWFPLGGYVKIAGMIDESMDKKQLEQPPQPWEFRSKPAWQRLIVMVAGVVMNLILGILIFSFILFHYGEQYIPVNQNDPAIVAMDYGKKMGFQTGDTLISVNGVKYSDLEKFQDLFSYKLLLQNHAEITVQRNGKLVTFYTPDNFLNEIADLGVDQIIQPAYSFKVKKVPKNSTAYKSGLRDGDRIVAINDTTVRYYWEFVQRANNYRNKNIDLTIKRNDKLLTLNDVPVNEKGKIGFYAEDERVIKYVRYNLAQALRYGNSKAWNLLKENTLGFISLFRGDVDPRKALKGPVGIATIYGGEWIWINFWTITGLLSLVLAFMNLLPIPALDGGHVITIFIEMISGKPLSTKTMEVIQTIGIIIIFGLIIFTIFNDIIQVIF